MKALIIRPSGAIDTGDLPDTPEDVLKFHHPQGTRRGRTVGLPEDSIRKITALLRSSGAKPIVGTQQEPNTNGED